MPTAPLSQRCEHELQGLKRHYRRLLANYRTAVAQNAQLRVTGSEYVVTLFFTIAEVEEFIRSYVNPFLANYGLSASLEIEPSSTYRIMLKLDEAKA